MQNRNEAIALGTVFVGSAVGAAVALGLVILATLSPAPAQSVSDPGPGCAEWTDGCIVCQRTDQGPVCSMPGIACVRAETSCLRREGI